MTITPALKIADIMTREVFTLSPDLPADEAAASLAAHGVGGAPVLEADGRIVGILSRTDLTDPERRRPGTSPTVRDLMTPGMLALRASDTAMNAVRLMVREEVHHVIVLGERGELAGIVTSSDVLRALVAGDPEDAPAGDPSDPATIH